MLAFGVLVALRQAKINDINVIFCALVAANEEIIRFYISVNDSLFMYFLNSLDHLVSNVAHSLQIKLSTALLE